MRFPSSSATKRSAEQKEQSLNVVNVPEFPRLPWGGHTFSFGCYRNDCRSLPLVGMTRRGQRFS
jgi:hypothetical protein